MRRIPPACGNAPGEFVVDGYPLTLIDFMTGTRTILPQPAYGTPQVNSAGVVLAAIEVNHIPTVSWNSRRGIR